MYGMYLYILEVAYTLDYLTTTVGAGTFNTHTNTSNTCRLQSVLVFCSL